eukprot:TRINITY_DN4401_c0_g1_i1.p1 TRINITY_DN4401_c0_g1~~TRINITY_DN4401_c0_g1_i1.p1  ORF type:complete len:297 (+),score=32.26 TRINITY_DN4401_c0_g1_i1:50-940(+)
MPIEQPETFYILLSTAVGYFIVTCVSLGLFIDILRNSPFVTKMWTTQRLFYAFMVLAVFAKTLLYSVLVVEEQSDTTGAFNDHWHIVFTTAPDILIFIAFALLLIFFGDTYLATTLGQRRSLLSVALVAINTIFMLIIFSAYGLMFCCMGSDVMWYRILFSVVACCFLVMDCLTSIGLIVFGRWMMRYYREIPLGNSKDRERAAQRVSIYVGICAACFIVRATFTVVVVVNRNLANPFLSGWIYEDLFTQMFITVPEIGAIICMLLWMRYKSGGGVPTETTGLLSQSRSYLDSGGS